MKLKSIMVLAIFLSGTSAMANTPTFTQKLLAPVITLQCENELKQSKLWQASTVFMQESKRNTLKSNICDCVGKNALNGVDKTTLAKAAINEAEKNQLIKTAVLNSLNACVGQVIK